MIRIFDVNGVRFTVKYLGHGRYRVIGPGWWFREYSAAPNFYRDVLCAHLNEAGKARRIDHKTANWPEIEMREAGHA